MIPTAAEARSVPRLSTARKRTPVLPSAEPALPTSKAARLSSAMTARYGRYSGASAARGVPRQSVAPRDSMAHPVRASPILYDDHDGMRALRNVAENLLTTLTLQAFLRWKVIYAMSTFSARELMYSAVERLQAALPARLAHGMKRAFRRWRRHASASQSTKRLTRLMTQVIFEARLESLASGRALWRALGAFHDWRAVVLVLAQAVEPSAPPGARPALAGQRRPAISMARPAPRAVLHGAPPPPPVAHHDAPVLRSAEAERAEAEHAEAAVRGSPQRARVRLGADKSALDEGMRALEVERALLAEREAKLEADAAALSDSLVQAGEERARGEAQRAELERMRAQLAEAQASGRAGEEERARAEAQRAELERMRAQLAEAQARGGARAEAGEGAEPRLEGAEPRLSGATSALGARGAGGVGAEEAAQLAAEASWLAGGARAASTRAAQRLLSGLAEDLQEYASEVARARSELGGGRARAPRPAVEQLVRPQAPVLMMAADDVLFAAAPRAPPPAAARVEAARAPPASQEASAAAACADGGGGGGRARPTRLFAEGGQPSGEPQLRAGDVGAGAGAKPLGAAARAPSFGSAEAGAAGSGGDAGRAASAAGVATGSESVFAAFTAVRAASALPGGSAEASQAAAAAAPAPGARDSSCAQRGTDASGSSSCAQSSAAAAADPVAAGEGEDALRAVGGGGGREARPSGAGNNGSAGASGAFMSGISHFAAAMGMGAGTLSALAASVAAPAAPTAAAAGGDGGGRGVSPPDGGAEASEDGTAAAPAGAGAVEGGTSTAVAAAGGSAAGQAAAARPYERGAAAAAADSASLRPHGSAQKIGAAGSGSTALAASSSARLGLAPLPTDAARAQRGARHAALAVAAVQQTGLLRSLHQWALFAEAAVHSNEAAEWRARAAHALGVLAQNDPSAQQLSVRHERSRAAASAQRFLRLLLLIERDQVALRVLPGAFQAWATATAALRMVSVAGGAGAREWQARASLLLGEVQRARAGELSASIQTTLATKAFKGQHARAARMAFLFERHRVTLPMMESLASWRRALALGEKEQAQTSVQHAAEQLHNMRSTYVAALGQLSASAVEARVHKRRSAALARKLWQKADATRLLLRIIMEGWRRVSLEGLAQTEAARLN